MATLLMVLLLQEETAEGLLKKLEDHYTLAKTLRWNVKIESESPMAAVPLTFHFKTGNKFRIDWMKDKEKYTVQCDGVRWCSMDSAPVPAPEAGAEAVCRHFCRFGGMMTNFVVGYGLSERIDKGDLATPSAPKVVKKDGDLWTIEFVQKMNEPGGGTCDWLRHTVGIDAKKLTLMKRTIVTIDTGESFTELYETRLDEELADSVFAVPKD